MKYTLLTIFLTLGIFGFVLAQEELPAKEPLPELPGPGLKPGDPFFFLDQWAEAVQELFVFNAEAKAVLQAERALERIAEVNAILDEKGVDSPSLDVAHEKIKKHMAKAADILEKQKAKGREIAALAKTLDKKFDARQELLKQVFETKKAGLGVQKEEVKLQIKEARNADDFERVTELRLSLSNIEERKAKLKEKREHHKNLLEEEEDRIESGLEEEEKALEALEEEEEDLLEQKEEEVEIAFERREKALELEEKALELDLRKAVFEKKASLAKEIRAQLLGAENRKGLMKEEKETAERSLEKQEEKLEKARDLKTRAEEQIKEAAEELAEARKKDSGKEIPVAVASLIFESQEKLSNAKTAFSEGKYGEAYGQAIAAERLARNAQKKIEQEGDIIELELEELGERLKHKERAEEKVIELMQKLEEADPDEKEDLEEDLREAEGERDENSLEVKEIRDFRNKVDIKERIDYDMKSIERIY